jgi:hypothetical protein
MNNKKWAFAMPLISMFISDLFFEVLYINNLTDYQGFYSGRFGCRSASFNQLAG